MTLFEDPLYQKFVILGNAEYELRQPYLRWINTLIPYFDLSNSVHYKDVIEIKTVNYVYDALNSGAVKPTILPSAIIRVLVKTEYGFNDTIRRVPLDKFGQIGEQLIEEFQYFMSFRKFHYELCEEINEKYMRKHVTNGTDTYKITKIEYHSMPLFYARPNVLDVRINEKEYWLK